MKNLLWENINNLETEDITYMLSKEGKSVDAIAVIRNISRGEVEKHLIKAKIKYKIYKNGTDEKNILKKLMECPKDERLLLISLMPKNDILRIEKYIIDNLFHIDKEECTFYIWFLGEIKSKSAVDVIILFLRCSDGRIKKMCCSALSKIGDKKAENGLIWVLNDKRSQVRSYAIKALGNIKSEKSLEKLKTIAASNEKDYVKRAAIDAIKNIENLGEV